MSKNNNIDVKVADTLNNVQYDLEDIRDLTRVLVVSLKNQISIDDKPLGILTDEGKSIYPVGEGLSELARTIELRLNKNIEMLENTYKEYKQEEDK